MKVDQDGFVKVVSPDGQSLTVHAVDAKELLAAGYTLPTEARETPGEHDDGKFAVMRKGGHRALKLCDTQTEAEDYITNELDGSSDYFVEPRK